MQLPDQKHAWGYSCCTSEDERYQDYIEKPLFSGNESRNSIVADRYVDREFGTGVVKITPAHDLMTLCGNRHNLQD